VRTAVARRRRGRRRVDDHVCRARGGGAAVHRDRDGVRPRVGERGARARRVLLRRREAVRAGPGIRRAAHGRRGERDGGAFAIGAAVRRGGGGGGGIDDDVRRAGGRGAAVHGDGDGVRAGVGDGGARPRRVLIRRGEA